MQLHIDLDAIVIRLVDASDASRLEVVIDAPDGATPVTQGHRLGDVVAARHVGRLTETGDIAVDPAVLRFLAAGEVGESWDGELEAMIEVAGMEGRRDPAGWVLTPVRWPSNRR